MATRGREKERSRHYDEGPEHKLYIGGLPVDINDSDLRDIFNKYGDIDTAIVMKDHDGRSRSFGFVRFRDSEGVDEAMKARNEILIRGRQLEIRRAFPREMPSEQQVASTKLFVGGCRGPVDENALREYFSKYGTILSVEVIKDRAGETRGFGFVEFDDYDACDKIVLEGEHRITGRLLEIRKYLNREQFENAKRRNAENEVKQGPPPPYMPAPNYGGPPLPPGVPGGRYGNGAPDFERERMPIPIWDRLFGLSDEERARELMQVEEEYFIHERERLERQLRELDRLESERRRYIERMRGDRGGSSYRERSPLLHRSGSSDYDRRGPPNDYHAPSYNENPYNLPQPRQSPYSGHGYSESDGRRFDDYRGHERDGYGPPPGPPQPPPSGYRR